MLTMYLLKNFFSDGPIQPRQPIKKPTLIRAIRMREADRALKNPDTGYPSFHHKASRPPLSRGPYKIIYSAFGVPEPLPFPLGLSLIHIYGPLGVELKNNVKKAWWKKFVQENPYNCLLYTSRCV